MGQVFVHANRIVCWVVKKEEEEEEEEECGRRVAVHIDTVAVNPQSMHLPHATSHVRHVVRPGTAGGEDNTPQVFW